VGVIVGLTFREEHRLRVFREFGDEEALWSVLTKYFSGYELKKN
jgi:hypothetical protein